MLYLILSVKKSGGNLVNKMNLDKQKHFFPFVLDEQIYDLSLFDSHIVEYESDKKTYKFFVTYSMHCFTKDYPEQTKEEKQRLMYHSDRESRPFCFKRYRLAVKYLRDIIKNLDKSKIGFAGYDNFATIKVIDEETQQEKYYKVTFVMYRFQKKLRLHITSAYPIDAWQKLKPISFFKLAENTQLGKKVREPK